MDAIPNIAPIARLMGDRARAAILTSLLAGRSLTATELARAAGVSKPTASSHLAKLAAAHLVTVERTGRHRYFRLADHEVAAAIEGLMGLAGHVGAVHVTSGPADPDLRKARTCYDHLAGDLGVLILDSLTARNFVRIVEGRAALSDTGAAFMSDFGIDLEALQHARRPMCLACLDWSVRRPHLAGALGAAILNRCVAVGWARPHRQSRVVYFSAVGERGLRAQFRMR